MFKIRSFNGLLTKNLIVSRSFSKAYGLAGLRIGYGVSSPRLIELMNRVSSLSMLIISHKLPLLHRLMIKILLKKDGKFSGTCASNSPFLES